MLFDRRENALIKREIAGNALSVIVKYLSSWEKLAVPTYKQVTAFLQDSPQLKLSRRELEVLISNSVEKAYASQPIQGVREIIKDTSALFNRDHGWQGKYRAEEISDMLIDRGLGGYVHAIKVEAKLRGEELSGEEWCKALDRLNLMNKEGILTKAEKIDQVAEQEVSSFTSFLENL